MSSPSDVLEGLASVKVHTAAGWVLRTRNLGNTPAVSFCFKCTRQSAFRPVADVSRLRTVSDKSRRARDQIRTARTHVNVCKRAGLARNRLLAQSRTGDGPERKFRTGCRDSEGQARRQKQPGHCSGAIDHVVTRSSLLRPTRKSKRSDKPLRSSDRVASAAEPHGSVPSDVQSKSKLARLASGRDTTLDKSRRGSGDDWRKQVRSSEAADNVSSVEARVLVRSVKNQAKKMFKTGWRTLW